MNIRQILEREDITRVGRMDCPRCKGEKDITASESKGVAKCWKCGAADYWTLRGWHLWDVSGGLSAPRSGPWQF